MNTWKMGNVRGQQDKYNKLSMGIVYIILEYEHMRDGFN